MADITARTYPKPSRSPLEVVVDRIWRFFCSVRAAVAEISFLTLLVLIGTLRGSAVPQWIADAVPALQGFVDRWYAWDVFRSSIFAATLAILTVAIIVCTLNRVPGIWATISHPKITTTHGFLRGAETSATFRTPHDSASLASTVSALLGKKRYRVLTAKVGEETHIYADKNRMAKLGTFPFHLALILLLVGGIIASVYGFRDEEFIIPEGSRRNVGHGTGLSVELNRFRDSWTEVGIPAQYSSDVTIYDGDTEVKSGPIQVNHPMSYANATFYQASFGNAAQMRITDANGSVLYSDAAEMGIYNLRGNPDAPAGLIRLPTQNLQITLVGPDIEPANQPALDQLQLKSGQLWMHIEPLGGSVTPITTPMGTGEDGIVLTQGQPMRVGDLSVTFERETRFTVLQVGYNPGIPIFIIAAFLLVGGLAITFYFPLRRMRGIITQGPNGAVLTLAPLAKRDWSGKRDFFSFLENARDAIGVQPEVKHPANAGDYDYPTKASGAS
jgi:cytochrome c biogenesis protein